MTTLFVVVVFVTQCVTVWLATSEQRHLLNKQIYSRTADTLAFLEASMESMTPTERMAFLNMYNRPGLPQLLPANASQVIIFDKKLPQIAEDLVMHLSKELRQPIQAYYSQLDGESVLWMKIHMLGEPYWLVLPFENYTDQLANSIAHAAFIVSIVVCLFAFWIGWWMTYPLKRLSRASDQLARGEMPKALVEQGPGEIKELIHNFNHMARALDDTERERQLMLAGLSHDLRTPLTRLKLALEMQLPSEDQQDMLSDIDEMSVIIRQFIDFIRAKELAHLEELSIYGLMRQVVARFERKGTRIEMICPHDLKVIADRLSLERLLSNLLENAYRYGKPPFSVALHQEEHYAVLSVTDTGEGIPDALHDVALKPFERLAEHRGTDGGSGLGLAIVARIVKQHKGKLKLENNTDFGFRVSVYLPLKSTSEYS